MDSSARVYFKDFTNFATRIKAALGITESNYDASNVAITGGSISDVDATVKEYSTTNPSAPAAGSKLFSRYRSGRRNISHIGPSGLMSELQNHLAAKKVHAVIAAGAGSTVISTIGASVTSVGTNAAVTYDTSTILGSTKRVQQSTTAATAQSIGWVMGRSFARGSAAGCGGFDVRTKFVISTIASAQAWFAGMIPQASDIGDVDPSSVLNMIGVGVDAGDSNVQFMTNDGSGTAAKTDLGSNFPGKTNGAIYELRMFCKPNDTVVYWSLERFDSAQLTESSANSELPTNTTNLGFTIHGGTRAVGTAMTIAMSHMYGETEI